MNIFVLHQNPEQSARWHVDKHVVKLILEYWTMLDLCHCPDKKGWRNHPCSVWTRQSINNYRWLANLALEVCKEYTYRYGRVHSYQEKLIHLKLNEPVLPDVPMTPFVLAMPDDCKCEDRVEAYHQYYVKYKQHLAKWKNRPVPEWYKIENPVEAKI